MIDTLFVMMESQPLTVWNVMLLLWCLLIFFVTGLFVGREIK
jgi:hypothetical protein